MKIKSKKNYFLVVTLIIFMYLLPNKTNFYEDFFIKYWEEFKASKSIWDNMRSFADAFKPFPHSKISEEEEKLFSFIPLSLLLTPYSIPPYYLLADKTRLALSHPLFFTFFILRT